MNMGLGRTARCQAAYLESKSDDSYRSLTGQLPLH